MLDRDMREPLFDFLDEHFGKIRTIEEKVIEGSRADVLGVLDGYIVGFEIKSDGDTYTRLKTQIKDYDRFCDFCYIVVGQSHRKHVAEHVPEHWGIIAVTDEGTFLDRGADDNPKALLSEQILLMWKRELFQLLDMNGKPKYRAKSRKFLREYLLEHIPPEILKKQMTDILFERDYTVFDTESKDTGVKSGTGLEAEPGIKDRKTSTGKTSTRKKKSSTVKSVKSSSTIKVRKAIKRMNSASGDKKRAHTKNYIGKRKKK